MKTTFGGRAPRWRAASAYWATISAARRFRFKPIRPVSQNTHPRAQPTWDDTHTVQRSFDRRSEAGWWMSTVSTTAPSANRTAKRTVPSGSGTTSTEGRSSAKGACLSKAREGGSGSGRPAARASR